jgi:DNA-binding phage protein
MLLRLQDFSGAALTAKFSSTGLTQAKVFNSLSTSGEPTLTGSFVHCVASGLLQIHK